MDETYNLKAIILKRQDFREADSRIVLYSREKGKLDLAARGAKKPGSKMSAHLEPITLVDIMAIKGRQYDYVGSVVSADQFSRIKENLDAVLEAGRIIGFLEKFLKPEDPNPEIFDLMVDWLAGINGTSIKSDKLSLANSFFLFRLLVLSGYAPEFEQCVVCRRPAGASSRLSVERGGAICPICFNAYKHPSLELDNDIIKVFRAFYRWDREQVMKIKVSHVRLEGIKNIINSLYAYI